VRLRRFSGVVILAIGLGLAAGPPGAGAADEPVPPLVTTLQTVVDGAGDVINTITSSIFENPRADITGATLEYAPGWIRMKVQVKTGTDPLKDEAWSDKSDAEWVLDTDVDGMPDYTVEFATDQGEIYGAVFDVKKPDEKSVCDADSASYSAEDGYTLVIDPACIGKPQKLGYAVAMFLDTNPKDDKAPMATDRIPDQGFKEVLAPVQPGETPPAPAPATPTAPAAAAPPSSAGSGSPAPRQATAPAPRAAAAAPAPGAPVPDTAAAPAAGPNQPSPAPGSPLARTGSSTTTHGLLGLGVMLLGAGLLVMTRPSRNAALLAR
jgi:hypothetical protein